MTKWQEVYSRATTAELGERTAREMIEKVKERERRDHVQRRRDRIADGIFIFMCAVSVAVLIYAFAMFGHWCQYGY
jgi:hypothetical protein